MFKWKKKNKKVEMVWPTRVPSHNWKYPYRYDTDSFWGNDRVATFKARKEEYEEVRRVFLQQWKPLFDIGDVVYVKTWYIVKEGNMFGEDRKDHDGYCLALVLSRNVDIWYYQDDRCSAKFVCDVVLLDKDNNEIKDSSINAIPEYDLHNEEEKNITVAREMAIKKRKDAWLKAEEKRDKENQRQIALLNENRLVGF